MIFSSEVKQDINEIISNKCFHSLVKYSADQCINILNCFEDIHELRDSQNNSLLMIASFIGCPKKIKYLLDRGCDILYKNENLNDSFHMACSNGSIEAIKILIEKGANLTNRDVLGANGLNHALFSSHYEVINYLLNNETFYNAISNDILLSTSKIVCISKI